MDSFRLFLNEMLVHRLSTTPNMVVAFRQHLWLLDGTLDNDNVYKIINEIISTIQKEHPGHPTIRRMDDLHSLYDLVDYVPDTFVGEWNPKTRILWTGRSNQTSYQTSPLAKKVAQALGARSIQYSALEPGNQDDYNAKVTKQQMKGDWPDIAFHGTTSSYIGNILSKGLKADESDSNWPKMVTHHDKVFLTAKLEEAKHHAVGVASGYRNKDSKGAPVVIAVKIPDKNLIVPDYDVDAMASRSNYKHNFKPYELFSVDSMKASKHAGIFGYRGRIPASHIEYFLLWNKEKEKWIRKNPKQLKASLNKWGRDYWYIYGYKG